LTGFATNYCETGVAGKYQSRSHTWEAKDDRMPGQGSPAR
jgi:hypothetical protein